MQAQNTQAQTVNNTPTGQNQTAKTAKPEKVFVPLELHTGQILSEVALRTSKGLGDDSFVVLCAAHGVTLAQYTIHRPVGYHQLPEKSWVMTPSGDIPGLLSHAVHPAEEKIQQILARKKEELLIVAGFLEKMPDGKVLLVNGLTKHDKQAVLDVAKHHHKEAAKQDLDAHDAAQAGKPKAAKYRGFKGKVEDFYTDDVKEYFQKSAEFIKTDGTLTRLRKELHGGYVTGSGPLGTNPQHMVGAGTRTTTIDGMMLRIFAFDDDDEEEEETPPSLSGHLEFERQALLAYEAAKAARIRFEGGSGQTTPIVTPKSMKKHAKGKNQ